MELCFDSNYQLSASIKAKKSRQVQISLLITALTPIKGADGSNWWLIASTPLSQSDAAPVNLVTTTTPTELNFKGDYWEFYWPLSTAQIYSSSEYIWNVLSAYLSSNFVYFYDVFEALVLQLWVQYIWASWSSRVWIGVAFWRRDVKWNEGENGKGNGQDLGWTWDRDMAKCGGRAHEKLWHVKSPSVYTVHILALPCHVHFAFCADIWSRGKCRQFFASLCSLALRRSGNFWAA